jgi:hypothetical protein
VVSTLNHSLAFVPTKSLWTHTLFSFIHPVSLLSTPWRKALYLGPSSSKWYFGLLSPPTSSYSPCPVLFAPSAKLTYQCARAAQRRHGPWVHGWLSRAIGEHRWEEHKQCPRRHMSRWLGRMSGPQMGVISESMKWTTKACFHEVACPTGWKWHQALNAKVSLYTP